jgi:hypothetical protein
MSSPTLQELIKAFPKADHSKLEELVEKMNAAVDSDEDGAIDEVMTFANETLDGHGVEAIAGNDYQVDKFWMDTVLLYVNFGDTYDKTLLYNTEENEFSIGSWGDFMEEWEKEDDSSDEEEGDEEGDEDETEEEDAETEEVE